jgi:DNA processing protein
MCERLGIRSRKYPKLLKEIKDPPKQIYYRGTWRSEIFDKCVAVVGSRKMTRYGRDVTERLVENLVSNGFCIASGFMYGVDAASHTACLNAGGTTVAVMPCGIEVIHPQYQEDLYNRLLENGGVVISEYESTFPPAIWTYPRRNRIIAGISLSTVVIEAGGDSGSLITASRAFENNRKVFAVPGSLFSKVSMGTNQLVKNGAQIVTDFSSVSDDLLSRMHKNNQDQSRIFRKLSDSEKKIFETIKDGPIGIDDLSRKVHLSVPSLGVILSTLEIDGFIYEEEGHFFAN